MESSNFTNEMCHPNYNFTVEDTLSFLYTPFGKYFVIVIIPLVSSFGLFGNLSFLYVVFRTQRMRTITNIYLANLAIADALLLVSGSIQYLWSYTHSYGLDFGGTFTFDSPAGCSLPNMLLYLNYFATVFLVTLVTMDRYLAICHTLTYKVSQHRAVVLNITAWILALALAGFQIPYFDVRTICVSWPPEDEYIGFPNKIPICFHACQWCAKIVVWADFIHYIIAVPAVCYMSFGMVLNLRRSLKRSGSIRSSKSIKARVNLVRMLQINALVFFLCRTPYEIINVDNIAKMNKPPDTSGFLTPEQSHYIKWFGRITMLVNSAVNPLIYSIVNPTYRQAFLNVVCCCCCCSKNTQSRPGINPDYEMISKSVRRNGVQTS